MGNVCHTARARLGADPEGFFERNGQIVCSEEILKDPVVYTDRNGNERGKVVRDGIQLEIQPLSSSCRANSGNFIQCALIALKKYLDEKHPDVTVKFYRTVEIPEAYFKTLPEKVRELGCMPSFNLYRPATLDVDPLEYRLRSCGGHIHMGDLPFTIDPDRAKRLVRLLDVVLGTAMVLIDRDPGNEIRRRVYGRAGEYRLPTWGLEYRTPSNFWLHAYPLQSLVFALARQAAGILNSTLQFEGNGNVKCEGSTIWDAEGELLSQVKPKDIVRAINTNDLDLAQKNWEKVGSFLKTYFIQRQDWPNWNNEGIHCDTYDDFNFFAQKVQEHGLEYYWNHDPFKHWVTKPEGHGHGWESFVANTIRPARMKKIQKRSAA